MKAEKPNNNIFSISEIIKAKKNELTSNQNSLKETNSALTKTKDYSKEENFHQSIHSGKLNKSKKFNDKNSNSTLKRFFPERRLKYKTRSYLSNNKSIYSKNLNLQLKNIESILKYKDDAIFNDSNYCDSKLQDFAKLSNDKTNISSNSNICNNNNIKMNMNFNLNKEKSKRTVSKIQHKLKRSSMSSKFLNLYLGDIKNLSKEDSNINLLTQINLNINSLLTTTKDEKKENEFDNITILNISDSYLEDLDENSRIRIRKKNFFTEEKISNFYDFNEESDYNRNATYFNNITSKFNYVKNSNYLNFNINADNINSNLKQNCLPAKIKKNMKNFENKNNSKKILTFENEFISCLSDDYNTQAKREDNTVMNLFNYLNFSDSEINNKNSNNNLNFNFTSTESENVLYNSNNFNNNIENQKEKCNIKDNNLLKFTDNSNYFQQSRNFCNKISGITTLKECLSGISKFSTINNNKKEIIKENTEYLNSEKSIITRKNSSIKNIIFKSSKENKLSNISILSIKSNNSCSKKRSKSNSDKENETIVNNKIKQTIAIDNNNNSDIDMSNYAFDVDEVFV